MMPSFFPDLGPSVPRRGTPLARPLARLLMRMTGWRFEGSPPDLSKAVLIVAPHTSNWDFLVGIMSMFALDLKVSWLGKHTLFRRPFGAIMGWLGGIPVDRAAPGGVVAAIMSAFGSREHLLLGLAPEGTRSQGSSWRSGFWRIARAAEVPVVPVFLDFPRRVIGFAAPFDLSDDFAKDLEALQNIIRDSCGPRTV